MVFVKRDHGEAQQAFLPKTRDDALSTEENSEEEKGASKWDWRIGVEMFMAFAIVILLACLFVDRKKVQPSPVPSCTFVTCHLNTYENRTVAKITHKFH